MELFVKRQKDVKFNLVDPWSRGLKEDIGVMSPLSWWQRQWTLISESNKWGCPGDRKGEGRVFGNVQAFQFALARRSNQSVLKEINHEYSPKGQMLKLKLQPFGHLMQKGPTHWKRPWCWEKHHWLNGHESEHTLGDGDGQGSLACCRPWGRKESTWLSEGTTAVCPEQEVNLGG